MLKFRPSLWAMSVSEARPPASAMAWSTCSPRRNDWIVPERWVEGERRSRVTTLLPVALLAALVTVQTVVGDGGALVLDARAAALAVAVVLLLLRANFLVVVVGAAVVAGALRAFGWS